MKTKFFFKIVLLFLISLSLNCKKCKKKSETNTSPIIINPISNKINKVYFYLENSASMFGYISKPSKFQGVISDIVYKKEFNLEEPKFEFNLINGEKPIITNKGTDKNKIGEILNINTFNVGNTTASNINKMFQIALEKAKNDTISILISDCIYDVSTPGALITAGAKTKSEFDKRLSKDNIQTLLIKLNSEFEGNYYPITKPGIIHIDQERPYYIWIFGESKLINKYFTDSFIQSLKGYKNFNRFLKLENLDIDYQITTKGKIGTFRFITKKNTKRTIYKVKKDPKTNEFQFPIAVDFSTLPFSNEDLSSLSNYECNLKGYKVVNVTTDTSGVFTSINETHLVYVKTNQNPIGNLKVSLNKFIPTWIETTNIDNEKNIDTNHTIGFKHLADAIISAYGYNTSDGKCIDLELDIRR